MMLLANITLRSSVVLVVGLAIASLLGRRSAAARHAVLAATIFAAAAVAPLTMVLPSWDVAVFEPARTPPPLATPLDRVQTTTAFQTTSAASAPAPLAVSTLALLVWAAGWAASLAMFLAGIWRLRRTAGEAARVRVEPWCSAVTSLQASFGLKRQVTLLLTGAPDLLATWGVFRPHVLLPSHALTWSEERARVVLCHELAHIRRNDWLIQIAAEAVRTVCWFNPLWWMACTRLRRESEQACDDMVITYGVPARDYAGHLLELARQCRKPRFRWASAVPMARPSTLERRIAAMLNPSLNRGGITRPSAALTIAVFLALALPAAALRSAQTTPVTLTGSVYDASGAVLPGVELTLENEQQAKWKATTTAAGRFDFPQVAPGKYVVSAALPGFRALRQEFELRNARDWDRVITLQVGALTETINVSERRLTGPVGPSRPQLPHPIRVGGNIRVPRKEVDVHPVYPQSMREAGREGVVAIEAVIGQDGSVTSVRVTSTEVHPDFAIAAVDAVRQWRFTPTLLNGSPVDVVMNVSVRFSLSD